MKRVLFLHIGMPKTATTSVQNFMLQNQSSLKAQGYLYPRTGLQHIAHHPLGNLFRPTPVDWIEDRNPEHLKASLEKEVAASGCQNVVMSTESLFYQGVDPSRAQEFFKEFNLRIILILRRPADWIESALRDNLKTGHYSGSAENYISAKQQFVNYAAQIAPWAKVFGQENMIVRTFEPGQSAIPEERRFLELIGAEFSSDMRMPERKNDRLSQDCLAFLRLMKQKKRITEKYFRWFGILEEYTRHNPEPPEQRSMLSPEQRAQINTYFERENREIAQTYLGRDHLFATDTATEQPWSPYPGLTAQTAVEIAEYLADRLYS